MLIPILSVVVAIFILFYLLTPILVADGAVLSILWLPLVLLLCAGETAGRARGSCIAGQFPSHLGPVGGSLAVPGLAHTEVPELSVHQGEEIQALRMSLPGSPAPPRLSVLCMPS